MSTSTKNGKPTGELFDALIADPEVERQLLGSLLLDSDGCEAVNAIMCRDDLPFSGNCLRLIHTLAATSRRSM